MCMKIQQIQHKMNTIIYFETDNLDDKTNLHENCNENHHKSTSFNKRKCYMDYLIKLYRKRLGYY